ncbi:MAG: VOC family protein [Chitinophagaceae bacterium]
MLTDIHPKLPMRDMEATVTFYADRLGFTVSGRYPEYLILRKDAVELHFFSFPGLDPENNYGQVYIRVQDIENWYTRVQSQVTIHPNAPLQQKPWGLKEFAILDPDNNLLTFGSLC